MAKRYLAVVLVGIAGIGLASMKAIVVSSYVADYNLSSPLAGYLLSVEMIAATVGTISSTLVPGRAVLFAALVAILVGDAGTALMKAGTAPFAWQVLAGLGHGFALGRLAAGVASVRNPQRLTGLYCLGYLVLSSLCGFYLPTLKHILGHHALFFMLALTGPLAMVGLVWFPPLTSGDPHAVKGAPKVAPSLALALGATMLLWYVSIGGYWPYISQIGAQASIPLDTRTRILGAGQLFGLAGVSLSILLGDRFRTFLPLLGFVTLQVAAALLLILAPLSQASFTTSAWLYVFGWLGGFPFLYGMLARLDSSGRLNALLQIMGNVAYALGPTGAGLLIRSAGSEGVGLSRIQVIGFGLLLLSGTMILVFAARASRRPAFSETRLAENLGIAEGA